MQIRYHIFVICTNFSCISICNSYSYICQMTSTTMIPRYSKSTYVPRWILGYINWKKYIFYRKREKETTFGHDNIVN